MLRPYLRQDNSRAGYPGRLWAHACLETPEHWIGSDHVQEHHQGMKDVTSPSKP